MLHCHCRILPSTFFNACDSITALGVILTNKTNEHDFEEHLINVPHSQAIGIEYIAAGPNECELAIRYAPHLIGNPDTGVIHGGAITALLDNVAGMVARPPGMQREDISIATLDLRIDYTGQATPGKDIRARGHCFKRTQNIAFVRAVAFTETPDDPVATCTATFMLGTRNTPFSPAPQAESS